MGLEILHLFQESTDYLAAATYVGRITSPVPVVLWHSAQSCPLSPLHPSAPPTAVTPHHLLRAEVAPAL